MTNDPDATRLPATDRLPNNEPFPTLVRSNNLAATDAIAGHSPIRPGRSAPGLPTIPGYDVTREIARGGMGRVVAARDPVLDREVAIKVLLPGTAVHDAVQRFVTESKITARLPHPNVPPVYELGTLADGSPFLAMKLIKGDTFAAQLRERTSPVDDLPRFVQTFEQVCLAVGFAHSEGVIHRDLKPANIMVGTFGEVQVMDWGLARLTKGAEHKTGDEGANSESVSSFLAQFSTVETVAGQVMGTPAYMPPEQARGEPVDCRADVFSLGAILCEILTGARPFAGKTSAEAVALSRAGDIGDAPARLSACGADAELVALAQHCLAPNAADRPADAKTVADTVAAYRTGVEERLRAAERERAAAGAKAVEQRKRHRVQRALVGAVVLLLFGAGAVGWREDRQAAKREIEAQRQAAETDRVEREKQEAELRQREKDDRAAQENRHAVGDEVARCEAALQADDAPRATIALVEIGHREAHPGADEFRARIARCRADHAMLVRLDDIETFRWTPVDGKFPQVTDLARKWVEAFVGYGCAIGPTPPDEVARRVTGALIRDRLLLVLDLWRGNIEVPTLVDILHRVDPDPVRDAIRTAVQSHDFARAGTLIDELIRGPGLSTQPARFTIALSDSAGNVLSYQQRRAILAAEWSRSPGSLRVAMALGTAYPMNQIEGAAERVRWFQAAVAIRPSAVSGWKNLVVALSDNERYDEAVAAARATLRLDPRDTDTIINMGSALRRKGDPDGAIAAYHDALSIDPNLPNPALYNNLGNALGSKNDLDGAIAQFKKAIGLDPKFAPAHGNLGNALLRQRNADAAIQSLRTAIELDPKDAAAHANLGQAYMLKRDGNRALAAFQESLRLDPKNVKLRAALGNLLWDKGDLEDAIGAFRDAIRYAPADPGLHNNLGALLRQTGDLKGAISEYRETIRLDPKHTRARYNLGVALRASGNVDGAIAAYRALLALDPNHAPGHNGLGNAHRDKGDLDGAIAEFRAALDIDPKNGPARANLTDALNDKAARDAKSGRIAPPPREVKGR